MALTHSRTYKKKIKEKGGGIQHAVLFFLSFFSCLFVFLSRWRRWHATWHAAAATEQENKENEKTKEKKEPCSACRRHF